MFDRPVPRPPPAELIRGLAVLAEPPTAEHPRIVESLDLGRPPTATEYSDLFLFQLYPYASVHLGPEGMMGGEARARVAGFWRALGYEPPAEPDHLAALLGLYATLAEAEAATLTGPRVGPAPAVGGDPPEGAEAHRRLIGESRAALLYEHLAPWVFPFLGRVRDLTGGTYSRWAQILLGVLRDEVKTATSNGGLPDVLPLHLRLAPGLPDPREEGAADFVAGLLAPVRSGFVLTRADVAGIASACDVGLRAGERRYALEHLLAQDAPAVLQALAAEVVRQGALHVERTTWLGETAAFFARRAQDTAHLLGELGVEESAREGVSP